MNSIFDIRRFGYYLKQNMKTSAMQFMYMAIAFISICLLDLAARNDIASFFYHVGFEYRAVLSFLIIFAPCMEKNINKQNSIFNFILPISNIERFLYLFLKYMVLLPLMLWLICYLYEAALDFFGYERMVYADRYSYTNIQWKMSLQAVSFLCYLYFRKQIIGKTILVCMIFWLLVIEAPMSMSMSHHGIHSSGTLFFKIFDSCAFVQEWGGTPAFPLVIIDWTLKLLLPYGLWVAAYFKLKEIEL
jgi:hypothetical protein